MGTGTEGVAKGGEESRAWSDVVSPKGGSLFITLCIGIGIPGRASGWGDSPLSIKTENEISLSWTWEMQSTSEGA